LVVLSAAGSARASSDFPASLQKALNKQFAGAQFCVPLCTACHKTTKGGPGDLNDFGVRLRDIGVLPLGNKNADAKVDAAISRYFAATPEAGTPQVPTLFVDGTTRPFFDTDNDGISDYTELQNSDSPWVPLPRGEKEFCPDIEYGCFARVASAPPPVDRWGLLCAALAVFAVAARRRLERARRGG